MQVIHFCTRQKFETIDTGNNMMDRTWCSSYSNDGCKQNVVFN